MPILRQVDLARAVAASILGDERARDVAQDVAAVLLEWGWYRWSDASVERLATDLARAEEEYAARHVWVHDVPHDPTDPEDPVTRALSASRGVGRVRTRRRSRRRCGTSTGDP